MNHIDDQGVIHGEELVEAYINTVRKVRAVELANEHRFYAVPYATKGWVPRTIEAYDCLELEYPPGGWASWSDAVIALAEHLGFAKTKG